MTALCACLPPAHMATVEATTGGLRKNTQFVTEVAEELAVACPTRHRRVRLVELANPEGGSTRVNTAIRRRVSALTQHRRPGHRPLSEHAVPARAVAQQAPR